MLLSVLILAAACANPYLDIMEKAVTAYSDAHVAQYVRDVEREGVQEHGFPRLTANLGILVANGRLSGKKDLLRRMMTASCRDAAKGKMPPKSGGNEFSVKELAYALVALEKAGTFPKDVTDAWRADLRAVDAKRCYSKLPPADAPSAGNWPIFGCASEQVRLSFGLGGDPAHVEYYVADQLKWFDELGMYKDPNQPAVYDMVTRLQFAHILTAGYDGPSRPRLEELMDKSAEPTLKMLSACGEIPYGGRSNQFLHNHTFYAALCEWYAARYAARGERTRARAFRSAAKRATDALGPWLAKTPLSHVKNGYPREAGKGVYAQKADMGCERYAYFDKYMITMGSWAMSALVFCTDGAEKPDLAPDTAPSVFVTSPEFHWVFLSAGPYSAQFDWDANAQYDTSGLGRIHRRGAPSAICLSTPCARHPHYRREIEDGPDLAIVPVAPEGTPLRLRKRFADAKAAHAEWAMGDLKWACALSADGFVSTLEGPSDVALALPAFESDGATRTLVSCDGKTLSVTYGGWVCRTVAEDGAIVATDVRSANRNGVYRRYEARGRKRLTVRVTIAIAESLCLCGEAPERANDFFWENDRVGFRAYGPGDFHKWSGIDVFNKCVTNNVVVHWLRKDIDDPIYKGWHKNKGFGMDDYAVGPGRGVGGVALRKDGRWLPDYGNWYRYRILTNCDERCAFELDYRLPIGGTMTLAVELARGSSFFRESVSFSPDVPLDGVEVGVGLDLDAARRHVGDVVVDARAKIVSIFEDPHVDKDGKPVPGEDGSMMSALVACAGAASVADGPNGGKLLMTKPLAAADAGGHAVIEVLAGADWTGAGRFRTAAEWHDFVKNRKERQK